MTDRQSLTEPVASDAWKRCNICKAAVSFAGRYYVCSVSTCNRKRTGMVFCTVECCDAHAPMMNHREYWAEERVAPTRQAWQAEQMVERAAVKQASEVGSPRPTPRATPRVRSNPEVMDMDQEQDESLSQDVLVVITKLKKYIKARSGMNTSDAVAQAVSDRLRALCDQAIQRASQDGRKTVMDRDFSG